MKNDYSEFWKQFQIDFGFMFTTIKVSLDYLTVVVVQIVVAV
tara:strand:+ start:468 stop:593 length:126 start_codon:yes stop_codon:yes gene_type:complete